MICYAIKNGDSEYMPDVTVFNINLFTKNIKIEIREIWSEW